MVKNMGKMDRGIRVALGTFFILLSAFLTQLVPPLRILLAFWGGLFLVTSSVGY